MVRAPWRRPPHASTRDWRLEVINRLNLGDLLWQVAPIEEAERAGLVSRVVPADKLLENLESTILRLQTMPLRGHVPLELERVGVLEFREVLFKPYRIIYEVVKTRVYVHCVLDGRRNMQDLLQERILRRGF